MRKRNKNDSEYKQWFAEIEEHIRSVQIKIALSVNSDMLSLYYDLGKRLLYIKSDNQSIPSQFWKKFVDWLSSIPWVYQGIID